MPLQLDSPSTMPTRRTLESRVQDREAHASEVDSAIAGLKTVMQQLQSRIINLEQEVGLMPDVPPVERERHAL